MSRHVSPALPMSEDNGCNSGEPESVNAELLAALKESVKSLAGYRREMHCGQPCDAERLATEVIARAESAIETPDKVSPCAGHAVQQEAELRPRDIVLKVAGKSFRCSCGCNVFQKLDPDNENEYTCNACHATYEAGGA